MPIESGGYRPRLRENSKLAGFRLSRYHSRTASKPIRGDLTSRVRRLVRSARVFTQPGPEAALGPNPTRLAACEMWKTARQSGLFRRRGRIEQRRLWPPTPTTVLDSATRNPLSDGQYHAAGSPAGFKIRVGTRCIAQCIASSDRRGHPVNQHLEQIGRAARIEFRIVGIG